MFASILQCQDILSKVHMRTSIGLRQCYRDLHNARREEKTDL